MNVYDSPLVRPITVQKDARVEVHENPPGIETTVNIVITEPPVTAGATHETTLEPFRPEVAVTDVGAPGTPRGTPEPDGRDTTEEPNTLEATTVNEYMTPFVNPTIVQVVSEVTQVTPSGFEDKV